MKPGRHRSPRVDRATVTAWAADLNAGATINEIAEKTGYHGNTIRNYLIAHGHYKPDPTKQHIAPVIRSPEKAFAAAIGNARYQDEPGEVWKSRTRSPISVRPGYVDNQTLGGVVGALA